MTHAAPIPHLFDLPALLAAAPATLPASPPPDVPGTFENRLNTTWVLLLSLPVYLMHGGFGFFEAGMTRRKSTVATLMHNLMVLAVTVVVFWLVGFGLMFGNGPGWIGLTGFAPSVLLDPDPRFAMLGARPVALLAAFAFALSYADTPATLIAGTNAERLKLGGFVVLTVALSGVIFPILARWIIGGGFLATRDAPVYDTGSGFIQLCGGAAALAVTLVLGPRLGRFDADGKPKHIPSHSLPLVFLGAFILWMGFLSFNMGFALYAGRAAGLVLANTVLGSMTAALGALIATTIGHGRQSLRASILGMLTGCVAITSAAGVVAPWAAAAIGLVAGLLTPVLITFWTKLRIDDTTEYLTMNVFGGALGMIAVGLLASPEIVTQYGAAPVPKPGLFYGGGVAQLVTQSLAVLVIVAFTFATVGPLAWLLGLVGWLRISAEEERVGSDRMSHGERGYCGFAWDDEDGDDACEPEANPTTERAGR